MLGGVAYNHLHPGLYLKYGGSATLPIECVRMAERGQRCDKANQKIAACVAA